jgi:iron complex transport system ATP-binding protein
VLRGVSAGVRSSELVVVLGNNGSGKSTLCQVLAGLRSPDAGQVLLEGSDLRGFGAIGLARRRAVLSQDEHHSVPLTAREVVALGRWPHGAAPSGVIDRSLARVGAAGLATRSLDALSGGERQRVHLARVLAQIEGSPGFLLLDEPMSALDPRGQLDVARLLWQLAHQERRGVLAVLHDLNLAAAWADRLILLSDGEVVASGPPDLVVQVDILERALGIRPVLVLHPHTGRPQCLHDA